MHRRNKTNDKMVKTWLITGGLGFVGTNLRIFIKQNFSKDNVIVVDNGSFDTGYRDDNATIMTCHINNYRPMSRIFRKYRPNYLVHLAARTDVRLSMNKPYECFEENVGGTLNCLELAKIYKCEMSLVTSSCGVVGESLGAIDEESSCIPLSPYASSKFCMEHLSHAYRRAGLNVCTLRLTNLYGPWSLHKTNAIPTFIRNYLSGDAIEVNGTGTQTRNFFYIEDAVDTITQCIKQNANFMVCAGYTQSYSIIELIDILSEIFGATVNYVLKERISQEVQRIEVNCGRLFSKVKINPKYSLMDGLRETVEWYKTKSEV